MKCLIVTFFSLIFFHGYAQNVMSLEKCIELAKAKNIEVVNQKYNNLKLKSEENISKGSFLPNLSFNASQNFNLGSSFNISTGVGQQESRSNNFNFTSSIVLFDGLSNINNLKLSKLKIENGELQLKSIEKALELSITNEYLQALFYKEALKITRNRLKNSMKQLNRVKILYENMSITKSELLENKSLVESDKNSISETENSLKNSLIKLKELISFEGIDNFDIQETDIKFSNQEMESFIHDGLDNHASVRVLESNMKISELRIKVSKAVFYPKISFDYSYGTGYYHLQGKDDLVFNNLTNKLENNGFIKQLDNNKTHFLGFSITIPVFNRFATKENYKKSKIDFNISEIYLINKKIEIINRASQAYNNVLTAKASLKSVAKILAFQEESFRVSNEKYELGISSVYDFIDSRDRLFNAQSDYVKSKYDYLFKFKILEYYYTN